MIGGNKKFKKIDYKNKKFENPFFDKKKKPLKKRKIKITSNLKTKIYILLGFLLIAFILWVFFYSSIFSIQKITVEGTIRIEPDEIANIAKEQLKEKKLFLFTQDNIFFFNTKELKNKLMDKYNFKEIKIFAKKPGTINIKVLEKSYAYVWKEDDKYYYVDIDGYIIKEINIPDIPKNRYPLIENIGMNKIYENQVVIDKNKINFISEIFSYLQEGNSYGIEIEIFQIGDDDKKIILKIVGGPEIYFNSAETADEQFTKLIIIKDEKLKSDFFSKTYIDLRYGDKVYYR